MILEKQKISEDDKNLLGGELLGQLWVISDRVKAFLHETPVEGESAAVSEYLAAELLGRAPATPNTVHGLKLLELAYERALADHLIARAQLSQLTGIDFLSGTIHHEDKKITKDTNN